MGRIEVRLINRPVPDPEEIRVLGIRCGIIRVRALTPRESLDFVEEVLGGT